MLAILAKATSGLVEWAPSQVGPLVAMQRAYFAACAPLLMGLGLFFAALALLPIVLMITKGRDWYMDDRVDMIAGRGIACIVTGILASITSLVLMGCWAGIVVQVHMFNAAPELYVLKALLKA